VTAYFIANVQVTDRDNFRDYQKGILRTIKPFGGWILAADAGGALEGELNTNQNVIIRFPTTNHVRDWWNSAAYKEIVPIRIENTEAGALAYLLPGMDGDVDIDSLERYPKRYAQVLGKRMAYVDVGEGSPMVFLHGNPTSSYLWRNVIPHLSGQARCIAPDLIGMGDSEKLDSSGPDSYRFVEHRRYLDDLLKTLGVTENVTFVVHDWGSALGFDWANRHRDSVKGVAYMEALVCPVTWEQWPRAVAPTFKAFRSPEGDEMILGKNAFVAQILPMSIMRKLGDAEKNAYGRPFLAPGEERRPTLTWPREIPIDGEPADVVEIVQAYADWLSGSELPKLFINAEPGAILRGDQREFCRRWPNQTEVSVKGIHFIQEDSPDEIGRAVSDWYRTL
jgi:haloalkane dehalogenase